VAETLSFGEVQEDVAAALGSSVEARWMLEEVSGSPLHVVREEPLTVKQMSRLQDLVARRVAGEPLQYVLGHWAFRRLEVMVDRRVLIPRPETEVTVDVALVELDRAAPGRDATVVDLGTGSGVIALAIATERPRTTVWATDASEDALRVASANLAGAAGRAATRVRLAHGSWWGALPERLRGGVDLVVANPPYIATAEMADLDPVVARWEPRAALEAGPCGLEDVEAVLAGVPGWVRPGGAVVIEIAPHQAAAAVEAAGHHGLAGARVEPDLAGRARVLAARVP
jgi:release factor glutamine methyltransferase